MRLNFEDSSSQKHRTALSRRYSKRLTINPALTRALVSFQANKSIAFYRWLKYKEAFSSALVHYCLNKFLRLGESPRRVLDPFAGIGTTLTTAAMAGCHATGIELLPVGIATIRSRLLVDNIKTRSFQYHFNRLKKFPLDSTSSNGFRFPHLPITEKAFSKETGFALSAYIAFLEGIRNPETRYLFWFACLSVLEDISYTRKDGQYLRWDYRSGRSLKSTFNKGTISPFRFSILNKLDTMLQDIKNRNGMPLTPFVEIIEGSCLTELPKTPANSFDMVVTSPPYCNRYDYTRTYALELAFMSYSQDDVKKLRQTLLSATVENKTKREQLALEYTHRGQEARFNAYVKAFYQQKALGEVLSLLYEAKHRGELNNNNIPNLVENYFFEMNFVIHELSRVLAPGGHIIMVNDNVQYNGEQVPVDLILSDFATEAGLRVDHIWVLPRGKGNSSQQMGVHGRKELRKCIYVWAKPFD